MFQTIFARVRERRPLVHCITNYISANDCANILLACGASPVMADAPQEAAEITARCAALCLNLGTLSTARADRAPVNPCTAIASHVRSAFSAEYPRCAA